MERIRIIRQISIFLTSLLSKFSKGRDTHIRVSLPYLHPQYHENYDSNSSFFLLTLLFLSCCSSCSDEKAPALKPEFSIAETDLQHDCQKEQTNISIPVKTNLNADEWSVKSNEDWCLATISRSTSQPSITIVVKANEEPDVRSTTVTVKTPISEHTIRINQLGYGKAVLLKNPHPR